LRKVRGRSGASGSLYEEAAVETVRAQKDQLEDQ
jgi:hypothetical protein